MWKNTMCRFWLELIIIMVRIGPGLVFYCRFHTFAVYNAEWRTQQVNCGMPWRNQTPSLTVTLTLTLTHSAPIFRTSRIVFLILPEPWLRYTEWPRPLHRWKANIRKPLSLIQWMTSQKDLRRYRWHQLLEIAVVVGSHLPFSHLFSYNGLKQPSPNQPITGISKQPFSFSHR